MKAHSLFYKSTLLLGAFFSTYGTVQGAPVADQLNYDIDTNEVIVNGQSFGEGPQVMIFENFEHGSDLSDHFESISEGWHEDVIVHREPSGNHAYRIKDHEAAKSGSKGMSQMGVNFGKHYSQAYVSFSIKTPEGTTFAGSSTEKSFPNVSSWKFSWLYSGDTGYSGDDIFDICLPTHVGDGNMVLGGNEGTLVWLSGFDGWWEWDNYNHIASYVGMDPNSPSQKPIDYLWEATNNRKYSISKDSVSPDTLHTKTYEFDRINIPGWWGNGDNSNFDALYDNIYVAVGEHALARLVITDNPKYTESTFSITIMPKSWSDSKIVLDSKWVPDDKAYYLHIFDDDNNRTDAGIRICPTCPKMEIH